MVCRFWLLFQQDFNSDIHKLAEECRQASQFSTWIFASQKQGPITFRRQTTRYHYYSNRYSAGKTLPPKRRSTFARLVVAVLLTGPIWVQAGGALTFTVTDCQEKACVQITTAIPMCVKNCAVLWRDRAGARHVPHNNMMSRSVRRFATSFVCESDSHGCMFRVAIRRGVSTMFAGPPVAIFESIAVK
jgi:hypothetical protein